VEKKKMEDKIEKIRKKMEQPIEKRVVKD